MLVIALAIALLSSGCGRRSGSAPAKHIVAVSTAPKFELQERDRDLGNISVDRERPFATTFEFRNAGGSELRILRIEQSCLCAAANVEPLVLPAGAEGLVRLQLKRNAPQPHSATVTLHTNDPNAATIRINVKWRAVAPVEFEPFTLDFQHLLPGETAEKEVTVVVRTRDEGSPPCELGPIECSPASAIEACWQEGGDAPLKVGDSRKLRLALHAGAEPGEFHGNVVLALPNSRLSDLTLPIQWTVRDLIAASPTSLFLGTGSAERVLSKSLTISAGMGEVLELGDIRVTPDDNTVSVKSTKAADNAILIRVEARLPKSIGPLSWQLAVACRRPVARTLTIPISAFTVETE